MQHLLADTEKFINLMMDMKYDIHSVIAKPYSIDLSVKERLLKAHALHIIQQLIGGRHSCLPL
ncbi:MAG: hypothetical protein LBI87_09370 [Candidatus Accumulibacter sp.]|nr:hypothetical protein [Accumulibacter sp.]